ncbi:MAG: hypothetical protein ACYCQJ_13090 [Nitrososphaerales archaeon]
MLSQLCHVTFRREYKIPSWYFKTTMAMGLGYSFFDVYKRNLPVKKALPSIAFSTLSGPFSVPVCGFYNIMFKVVT